MLSADSIKVVDSLKFETPKGKVVYGGGGIVPDVFVSIDTSAYFNRVHFTAMNAFVFDYIDHRRNQFTDLSFADFKENFDTDEVVINEYLSYIKETYNVEVRNRSYIKLYLKFLFAQLLFDDNASFEILNQNDRMLDKVRELEQKVDFIKP